MNSANFSSPEVRAEPDPSHKANVESQDSWVVSPRTYSHEADTKKNHQMDGVSRYIDWAVAEGFGVMDVNVPGHKPDSEEVILTTIHDHIDLLRCPGHPR